jgi:hypothetical protein
MKSPTCIMQSHVDAHFAGTITPDDERLMRAHLDTCTDCRARYRRRLLLTKLDPQALSADVRIAQGLGLRKQQARPRFVWPAAGALLAAAAAVLLLLRAPLAGDGFAARGGSEDAGAGVERVFRASPLHVYRVPPKEEGSGGPVPVVGTVRRDAELAFAYENSDRKKYVMIFAVNEAGRVYWFYPGWTNPTDNPRAIAISEEVGLHELPDAVVHRFDGSKLDIHSLFLDEPLTVREVEQAVARHAMGGVPGQTLSVPGGIDHVERVGVVP